MQGGEIAALRLEGVGQATLEVFATAGFTTVYDLKLFKQEDERLRRAVETLEPSYGFDSCHWKAMVSRCIGIIYRVRSAEAQDFVPEDYMCPAGGAAVPEHKPEECGGVVQAAPERPAGE